MWLLLGTLQKRKKKKGKMNCRGLLTSRHLLYWGKKELTSFFSSGNDKFILNLEKFEKTKITLKNSIESWILKGP